MAAGEKTAEIRAGALILALARQTGAHCERCAAAVCGHVLVIDTVLGFARAPRCLACLGAAFDRPTTDLCADVIAHIGRRDCFDAAWRWTSVREGSCVVADGAGATERVPDRGEAAALPDDGIVPDDEWDAGDMACGDLVLELRQRLASMPAGRVLMVSAQDPGAPEDLPAWSRMTGTPLVYAMPPIYCFRRRRT